MRRRKLTRCTARWASGFVMFCLLLQPAAADQAGRILETAGIHGGLVVHLGCGDGTLTAELRANDAYVVHGLSRNAAEVEAARRHIRSLGVYGPVSVDRWDGDRLPYADNLVNLIVAEQPAGVPWEEIRRVLAPAGVFIEKQGGAWKKTVKPWPGEIDEWTHFLHDSSNNAVAHDARVGPPRHIQWTAGPRWARSHAYNTTTSALVSANGRIFYIVDRGWTGVADSRFDRRWLCARDAFNGIPLWDRPLPEWGPAQWGSAEHWSSPPTLPRRLVAAGQRLFVTLGYRAPVSALDAATGKVLATYDKTADADEILWHDNLLIVRRRAKIPDSRGRHTWDTQVHPSENGEAEIPPTATGEQSILVVDPASGKTLWQWPETQMVTLSLAACNGRVCYHNFKEIVCLDLKTGERLWSADSPTWPDRMGTAGTLVMYGDVVLYTGDRALQAFSARTGELLWKGPRIIQASPWQPPSLLVADGLIWGSLTPLAAECPFPIVRSPHAAEPPEPAPWRLDEAIKKRMASPMEPDWLQGPEPKGLDPNTGKVERVVEIGKLITPGHHVRCYRAKATDNYLLYNKRGIEFVDIKNGEHHARSNWTRGECFYGVMPANGLVYVPPHPCACYLGTLMNGFLAYAAELKRPIGHPAKPVLEEGPAFGTVGKSSGKNEPGEWPTYRHDAARSGSADCRVPTALSERWRANLTGKLTAPVIAGGRVFVFSVDDHTLHCLDAEGGNPLWEKIVGGRVQTPPTIHRDMALFGCHDGSVYCLRVDDAALVWRLHAAPADRLIMDEGQLESAWPVHGSVLMADGLAYFAAGRSSYLDGGIYLYAVRPESGEVVHRACIDGPWLNLQQSGGQPYWDEGAKTDLLVTDKEERHVYMAQKVFDLSLKDAETPPLDDETGRRRTGLHLAPQSGFDDPTWFHRTGRCYSRFWPGHTFGPSGPRSGQLLVFDEENTYAVQAFTSQGRQGRFAAEDRGYVLCADDNDVLLESKRFSMVRSRPPRWRQVLPLRGVAMVLVGDVVFVAGPPNVFPKDDPYAALEGREGATLWAVSTKDGEKLYAQELEEVPVFDGMAAARGRLYLSTREGSVVCMAGSSPHDPSGLPPGSRRGKSESAKEK